MRQTGKRTYPRVAKPSMRNIDDFVDLTRRVERAYPDDTPLQTAQRIMRTKYHGLSWDWLLPSSSHIPALSPRLPLNGEDVDILSGEFAVLAPTGRVDPTHVMAGLVSHAETSAVGARGIAARLANLAIRGVPRNITQRDIATWVGDVASAAAYWRADYPLNIPSPRMADYMSEYSPDEDLLGDIDGIVIAASDPSKDYSFKTMHPLSKTLSRYYDSSFSPTRTRIFHAFCAIEQLPIEDDNITLSSTARKSVLNRVRACTEFFFDKDMKIIVWLAKRFASDHEMLFNPFSRVARARIDDWEWFATRFVDYLQSRLSEEERGVKSNVEPA